MSDNTALGIDFGGSAIKSGVVDVRTGELVGERFTVPTPTPATPAAVAEAVRLVIGHFGWTRGFGMTVPAVVTDGVVRTAANIDPTWIGTDAVALLTAATGLAPTVVNDADAAGLAEIRCGAGVGRRGLTLVLTLGTGIGSALVHDGHLVPNTEFGHLQVDGRIAEHIAAGSVKDRRNWSYETWATHLSRVLAEYEKLLRPDLFILGGGISRDADQWSHHLTTTVPVVPASFQNTAGIVGAAMTAAATPSPADDPREPAPV
ncbi:polyphosphate--glucose phosphotransferase [Tsukamurella sp. 1534]|uniref:polyphosphate--glucose phosphotransferase n=1 Tax=Tsukamurella sp. 1534 TaxID=1151061 RepID=UPI0002DB6E77|nr:ROK family protein [Tsukamurella sp. 1534]